jgi:3-isopropylmalate/(R)-2-methylmalate dehydratase small subunit
MALRFKGKVWVFGDNLDVDNEIMPFRKIELGLIKPGEYGKWVMTNVDPDFPKKAQKGDIMVTGTNMGCGHDHHPGIIGMKQLGISCIIAESFNRNFFKNCINIGVPIIEYKGIKQKVKEGDEVKGDLHTGKIKNLTSGETLKFVPLPDFLLGILEAGGINEYADQLIPPEAKREVEKK